MSDNWTKEEVHKLIDDKINKDGTYLEIEDVNLGDIGAKLLAEEFKNKKLKKLTLLRLWNCNIGEEGLKSIAKELCNLKSLERLSLGSNQFGSNGGVVIANVLSKLTSLKELWLGGSNLGPYESIAIVNEIKYLRQLWFLNFNINSIGDEGAKALIDILPNRTEKEEIRVGLYDNNLSSDVVEEIEKKGEEKNLDIIADADPSFATNPPLPTISYINSYSIRMYQHLTNAPILFPSLVNLSLRVMENEKLKIPDHCAQPVKDAIDREVWYGYTFGSIL